VPLALGCSGVAATWDDRDVRIERRIAMPAIVAPLTDNEPGITRPRSCKAMKFGVAIGNFGTFGEDPGVDGCLAVADEADRLGYDSVWVHDHVVMPSKVASTYLYNDTGASPFRAEQFIYDPLAVMAAVGARTSNVAIGTSVLVVPYRNPLLLAKMLSTIDRISHGRVILGIGVGWMAEEFEALGIADQYPQRGRVTDEFMAVCIDLWTQDGPSSFDGTWVSYAGVGANPLPVQKPHIPIWVGGKTKAAMRRVARYGAGYQTVASTPAQVADEVAAVRAEMERAGRDPDELVVSMLWAFGVASGRDQLIDTIGEYAGAGLHHLIGIPWVERRDLSALSTNGLLGATLDNLRQFAAEVLPQVR
jgi:probable F420-dependent oxidoreductase